MIWTENPDLEDAQAFRRLHVALGLLGVLLPLILAVTGLIADGRVQPSISDFFHTTQRDLFVGGLVAIGTFLALHRGFRRHPGRRLSPDLLAFVAGVAAIGVALIPNESTEVTTFSQRMLGLGTAPALHYLSALLLYLMMSLSCFMAFAPDADGLERRVYIGAGTVIFWAGCMVMVLSGIKNGSDGALARFIQDHNLIFWDESLGVWAFCLSWLLKGYLDARRRAKPIRTRRTGRAPGPAVASGPLLPVPGSGAGLKAGPPDSAAPASLAGFTLLSGRHRRPDAPAFVAGVRTPPRHHTSRVQRYGTTR